MSLAVDGFEFYKYFVTDMAIQEIIADMDKLAPAFSKHGIRNAEKKRPAVYKFVNSAHLIDSAQQFLPGTPRLVSVLIFDKTPDKNWLVSWHQDKTIAVNKQVTTDGWRL